MPVTKDQAQMLAALASACRPHGATTWDAPGILAAIGKVKHIALADVMRAVANAADDRAANTPGVIANLRSACWQDRPVRPAPTEVLTPAERCGICSEHKDRCRAKWHDDHAFEPGFVKHDGVYGPRVVEAIKAEVVKPTAVVDETEETS